MLADIETAEVTQPTITTLPRDAKPSEIVRSMPDEGCIAHLRVRRRDGSILHCAIGELLEQSGFSWSAIPSFEMSMPAYLEEMATVWPGTLVEAVTDHLVKAYGLSQKDTLELASTYDWYGKDAAADLLESRGM